MKLREMKWKKLERHCKREREVREIKLESRRKLERQCKRTNDRQKVRETMRD